jgi:hypothetical protein
MLRFMLPIFAVVKWSRNMHYKCSLAEWVTQLYRGVCYSNDLSNLVSQNKVTCKFGSYYMTLTKGKY